MLWFLLLALIILWALGAVSIGGIAHLLLIVILIVLLVQIFSGRGGNDIV